MEPKGNIPEAVKNDPSQTIPPTSIHLQQEPPKNFCSPRGIA